MEGFKMVFKRVLPRVRSTSEKIRVSFTGDQTIYANIYLGKSLLEKLKWDVDGRVYLYTDDENSGLWMLERAADADVSSSFKLVPNKGATVSKLQFRLPIDEPINEEQRKSKEVEFELKEGCVILKDVI